jgi:glycosyltransferase involved in cell wall biosynthesis
MVGTARDLRKPSRVRALLKRLFIYLTDAIAPGGKAAADYVKSLGAKNGQIFIAPQACDTRWIQREASKVNPTEEKRRRGYPPRVLLYSGRLSRQKGVLVLLEAYRRVSAELPDVGLLFVGEGPEKEAMQRACQKERLDRVYFAGGKEYREMPAYYPLADVLVLPTFSDTWGWVVNEAFACGVPAIVSRVAGACDDLIIDGQTGYSTEPGNAEELADRILRLLKNDEVRASMGRNARQLIEGYSIERLAGALLAAATGAR